MSSSLRLSMIMVLLLATAALVLMVYNMNLPKPVVQVTQNTPAPVTVGYFVAAHPLPAGTLARDENFTVRSVPSASVPSGAIVDTPDAKIGLRGSLVRKYLDTGSPVTSQDVLRPRDRGFLASALAPDSRAISINVDPESGVSGLIWPGDYVDVVLTQVVTVFRGTTPREANRNDKDLADLSHHKDLATRRMSETILQNVRIIATDQEIVQGVPANNTTAGRTTKPGQTQTVSLELSPEQVKKITAAKELGRLSLVVRAAVEQKDTADAAAIAKRDVPPEIARPSATVVVHAGDKTKEYAFKNQRTVSQVVGEK